MADLEDMIEYVFTWHSTMDARSCRKCVALNGREYRGQDLFAPVLIDAEFGPVWNLDADRSLMHGGSGTCRCRLTVRVERVEWQRIQGIQEFFDLKDEMMI